MKRLILAGLLVAIGITQSGYAQTNGTSVNFERHDNFPEFSWNTVPLYMHIPLKKQMVIERMVRLKKVRSLLLGQ